MQPEHISKLIPAIFLLVLGIIETLGGLYLNSKRTKNDLKIEIVSLLTLPTLIQPAIILLTFGLMDVFLPQLENYFIGYSYLWHILAFLILDDMMQYWWHRLSHINPLLWKLHRPHHVIEEMGVLVTYRNATLYYALMPGIWFSAILIYMGMFYVILYFIV